jgi:DNA modification methylase
MYLETVLTASVKPYSRNSRTHSKAQVKLLSRSIQEYGFTNPIPITENGEVIAGHARLEAAKLLGLLEVPVIRLSHLTEAQRKAYVIADNQLAINGSGWDQETLAIELQGLIDMNFDMDLTGFSMAEIDLTLDAVRAASPAVIDKADVIPPFAANNITRPGDLWVLGRHLLICGDAQDPTVFETLMRGSKADLIFTDPPYNLSIDGHVSGSGKVRHKEFAFASGEMSTVEFTAFLMTTLGCASAHSRDGAIAFVCMDWRHMKELMTAGELMFDELKQLCVWNKSNGGQGSFYRSKHELIFVYKVGSAPHINNFGLGETGRYRTNVWDYAGANSFSASRGADLAMHPTVKPVKMVTDAIEDCSRRGDFVLDCFGGSGTTLIAADRCGRLARLIEYDPGYCDVIIRRFQSMAGKGAVLAGSNMTFEQVARERLGEAA